MNKTLAVVTRVIEFSETSCVVTLFSRDHGKISGLAKGARRHKSPFEAALDLLAVCRIVFIHKSSDALDLLTEAKLERRFRSGQRDLTRLYAGYYVAELLNQLTHEDDPHPDLFEAADRTLAALDDALPIAQAVLGFEMTILRELGHMPSLAACAECAAPLESAARQAFGLLDGGLLCRRCKSGKPKIVSVRGEVIELLQRFAANSDDWLRTELPRGVHGELRAVVNQYFAHLAGHPLRMPTYLGVLAS